MLSVEKRCILSPVPGAPWAGKMVLNPAMVADPENPEKIHMLFRATGPWPQARLPERPLPYPIFLGYGVSCNGGADWQFDLSRPAMAPRIRPRPLPGPRHARRRDVRLRERLYRGPAPLLL